MLRRRPGTFVAGEMLDWEAPTGGYLLQAAFATGAAAGNGVLRWLERIPLALESGCALEFLHLRMSLSENRFPLFRDMR